MKGQHRGWKTLNRLLFIGSTSSVALNWLPLKSDGQSRTALAKRMSDIEDRHKHILINFVICLHNHTIIPNSCAEKSNCGGSCTRHKQPTLKAAPRETVNNDSLGRSQWSGTKSLSSSWNVWSLCALIDLCTQWVTDQSSYQIELITKLKWILLTHLNSSQSKEFKFPVIVLHSFFFFFASESNFLKQNVNQFV